MNTIWLKLAAAAVAVIVVIVIVGKFTGGPSQTPQSPQAQNKTFYDMADRDKQFGKEPKLAEPEVVAQPQANAQQATKEPNAAPQPPAQQTRKYVLPSDITTKTTLYFKPLSEEDDIAAQEQLPWATTTRSLGRLPLLQYGPMVTTCRRILTQWPDSWYAFRAKQMLNEIYENKGEQYKITEAELDISKFLTSRPGTQARIVEPVQR